MEMLICEFYIRRDFPVVFNLVAGVMPVMFGNTAQSSVVCQSVCLDLKWMETLCPVEVFTLDMPWMDVCVCVLGNLRRCTHLSVMKWDWEPLSNNALHGTYWPDLFLTSTMAVASKVWFLGLLFKVWYLFTFAFVTPFVVADWLFLVEEPLFVAWGWLSKCNNVWCLFWHLWHTCFEQVWSLLNDCKQLKHNLCCLAWLRRCLGCNLKNVLHLTLKSLN